MVGARMFARVQGSLQGAAVINLDTIDSEGPLFVVRHDHRGRHVAGEVVSRLEPLGLQEIYQIWDALNVSYRLSVSYEVSVVNIDAGVEPDPVVPVLTTVTTYGLIVDGR